MSTRRRADILLVQRGLFESRARAHAAIAAGLVTADNVVIAKPSVEISSDAAIEAQPAHPWVSRGGVKLAAALQHFGIDVAGRVCLDVGASTGGFSEVLLARGARLIHAVDVGSSQLHARLRVRPEIVSRENTDIRTLTPEQFTELASFISIDVSFISLKHVVPAALRLGAAPLELVALIKPQFEVPRGRRKRGIVRDTALHAAVCEDIATFIASLGCSVIATTPSPIAGGEGNREFFIHARQLAP